MSVKLTKGEKVSLKKSDGVAVKKLRVALGWNEIKSNGNNTKQSLFTSILKAIFGEIETEHDEMDCDASCICVRNGKVDKKTLVYYGELEYKNAIKHSGDNLTGGKGDCEQIVIKTNKLDDDIDKIYVFVNIYNSRQRHQTFGMVENAYIRVEDADTLEELCKFELAEDYSDKTGIIAGEFVKNGRDWEFEADGEGLKVDNIDDIVNILKEYKK